MVIWKTFFSKVSPLLALLFLLFSATSLFPDLSSWESYNEAGERAVEQGLYAEAEEMFQAALREADNFGPLDPRLAASLNNLASLYLLQGKYSQAEPIFLRALEIQEKILSPNHPEIAAILNNLGELYNAQGKYDRAEELFQQALEIREKTLGPDRQEVSTSLKNLAQLYYTKGKYSTAEKLYQRSLSIQVKALGAENPVVAETLNELAKLHAAQGNYGLADTTYKRALALQENAYGVEHPKLAETLNNIGRFYMELGRYTRAEPFLKRALDMNEHFLGQDNLKLAASLNDLAELYKILGSLTSAESLYLRALEIKEKFLGPVHPEIATSLNNLGGLFKLQGKYAQAEAIYLRSLETMNLVAEKDNPILAGTMRDLAVLYQAQGRYAKAESIFTQVLEIRKTALDPEHPLTAKSISDLGLLYYAQGKYAQAETFNKRALGILEKSLGSEHPDVAVSLTNLAKLYVARGKLDAAEGLFKRALNILGKKLGQDHPGVASLMTNLAILYKHLREYSEAETLQIQSLAVLEKSFGPEHPDVAASLNNLGEIYRIQGKFDRAEPILKRALEISQKVLGQSHPNSAMMLWNLAELYRLQGQYAAAEPLYDLALAYGEMALGKNHPHVANCLTGKAVIEIARNRPIQALSYLRRAIFIDDYMLDNVFSIASERDKFSFLATVAHRFEMMQSLVSRKLSTDEKAVRTAFEVALRRKGVVLDALSRERMALLFSDDPKLVEIAKRIQVVAARFSSLTLGGPKELTSELYINQLAELEAEKEQLEEELARMSKVYATSRRSKQVNIDRLREAMEPGNVLVEYVGFRLFDFLATDNKIWGGEHYLVFVLTADRNSVPKLIDLGEAEPIDDAVRAFRREITMAPRSINLHGEKRAERQLAEKGALLYELAISPIMEAVGESSVIYLATDGELNLIPFGVLQDDNGRYLAENYRFLYLSCGRDLLRFTSDEVSGQDVLVIADPDYDSPHATLIKEYKQSADAQSSPDRLEHLQRSVDFEQYEWYPLPGTRQEAEAIINIFSGQQVLSFLGTQAREEVIKGLRSPRILHMATHGFFLEERDWSGLLEKEKGTQSYLTKGSSGLSEPLTLIVENPLLRSGLVLAGANRLGQESSLQEGEDGVLTALEISGIPLWGTELVVLSACETGVGEARRGEGVFGLRRAFQLSGSRTVVMTLWSIPDIETASLITNFYGRLNEGVGKARALHEASLSMMEARRKQYGAAHPLFWGAFICIGEF